MNYQEWKLDTADGKTIHGINDFAVEGQKSDKILILVHGLTGHMNEYHIKTSAMFFRDKGYDVVRFNLYDGENGRKLRETTLQTYAHDLNYVLDNKVTDYKDIFIAGHSYGGPTIMIAQPKQATALSLWDPAFNIPLAFKNGRFQVSQQDGFYLIDENMEVAIGEDFVQERKTRYDTDECLNLSRSLSSVPVQVIAADECYGRDEISWHSAGNLKNNRYIVKNADHCFWRDDRLDEVLEESYQWFESFL